MDKEMKIVVGCDLAAYDFKIELLKVLKERGYNITDAGCDSSKEGDYTVYARKIGEKVADGEYDRGILICGTGQGMNMAANKVRGVRCALCYDVLPAILSREHNDSNVLATGAWLTTVEEAVKMIEAWLFGKFSGGRHQQRIQQLHDMDCQSRQGARE
ncbi:MAG: ribose 5-phosphate isomerase B [Proteobacteria bacterium]|nr:ribose 5-phosphate isomerase B [Pseudomonadota bacterium]